MPKFLLKYSRQIMDWKIIKGGNFAGASGIIEILFDSSPWAQVERRHKSVLFVYFVNWEWTRWGWPFAQTGTCSSFGPSLPVLIGLRRSAGVNRYSSILLNLTWCGDAKRSPNTFHSPCAACIFVLQWICLCFNKNVPLMSSPPYKSWACLQMHDV